MRAAVLTEINSFPKINDFRLTKEKGQIELGITASALNHRDLWITKGQYAGIKLPIILGSDGVAEYNNEKTIINPGLNWGKNELFQSKEFRVLGLPDHGTFAEKICIDPAYVYTAPQHLTNLECAALPLAGLTAYRALISRGKAKTNEKVLITGIGGGVALFALQFALALNCEVYVTSGHNEKISKAIDLGACDGVNYKDENWHKAIKQKAGASFDLIIDSAGGPGFKDLIYITSPGARIVMYGGTVGELNGLSPQLIFWKQLNIMGSTMGSDSDFKNMLAFVSKHKIRPVIDSVFELDDIALAFSRMQGGKQFGKIILTH